MFEHGMRDHPATALDLQIIVKHQSQETDPLDLDMPPFWRMKT